MSVLVHYGQLYELILLPLLLQTFHNLKKNTCKWTMLYHIMLDNSFWSRFKYTAITSCIMVETRDEFTIWTMCNWHLHSELPSNLYTVALLHEKLSATRTLPKKWQWPYPTHQRTNDFMNDFACKTARIISVKKQYIFNKYMVKINNQQQCSCMPRTTSVTKLGNPQLKNNVK